MDETNILSELNTMMKKNPMAEARRMRALAGNGMTQAQIAHELGVTQSFVSQRLSLLRLIQPLQDMLEEGQIGIGEARELGCLSVNDQIEVAVNRKVASAIVEATRW